MLSSSRIPIFTQASHVSHTYTRGIYGKKCKLSEEHHLPLEMITLTHTHTHSDGKIVWKKKLEMIHLKMLRLWDDVGGMAR